jgi:hypothetical protein
MAVSYLVELNQILMAVVEVMENDSQFKKTTTTKCKIPVIKK